MRRGAAAAPALRGRQGRRLGPARPDALLPGLVLVLVLAACGGGREAGVSPDLEPARATAAARAEAAAERARACRAATDCEGQCLAPTPESREGRCSATSVVPGCVAVFGPDGRRRMQCAP